jgi:hypothetical protein
LHQLQTSENWATFLKEFHWDYFFTSTFRAPRREPYYAMKGVWHELRHFNVARAFMGVEPHKSGDLHIHGIAAGMYRSVGMVGMVGWKPEIALPWDIWQGLFHRFGRAKVEECNSYEAVTAYCAKYVLKGQRLADHYDIFGEAGAWNKG